MKNNIILLFLLVMSFSLYAQDLPNIVGLYRNEANLSIQINEDYTFWIKNNGLCAGDSANGIYEISGDTLIMSTKYNRYPWSLYPEKTRTIQSDSVGMTFHDYAQSYIDKIYICYRNDTNQVVYELDSSQTIYLSNDEVDSIDRIYYYYPYGLYVNFGHENIKPGFLYHVSTISPCYPILNKKRFYLEKGGIYCIETFDGEQCRCVYKRQNEKTR